MNREASTPESNQFCTTCLQLCAAHGKFIDYVRHLPLATNNTGHLICPVGDCGYCHKERGNMALHVEEHMSDWIKQQCPNCYTKAKNPMKEPIKRTTDFLVGSICHGPSQLGSIQPGILPTGAARSTLQPSEPVASTSTSKGKERSYSPIEDLSDDEDDDAVLSRLELCYPDEEFSNLEPKRAQTSPSPPQKSLPVFPPNNSEHSSSFVPPTNLLDMGHAGLGAITANQYRMSQEGMHLPMPGLPIQPPSAPRVATGHMMRSVPQSMPHPFAYSLVHPQYPMVYYPAPHAIHPPPPAPPGIEAICEDLRRAAAADPGLNYSIARIMDFYHSAVKRHAAQPSAPTR